MTHVTGTNALAYNLCIQIFDIAPVCFGAIISQFSGSWHQIFLKHTAMK